MILYFLKLIMPEFARRCLGNYRPTGAAILLNVEWAASQSIPKQTGLYGRYWYDWCTEYCEFSQYCMIPCCLSPSTLKTTELLC